MKRTYLSIQHLQTMVAVAETGSFTLAAVRLGLTQPGISHGIRELETHLGVRLFERRRGEAASITNAGSRALIEARAALVHLARLEYAAYEEAQLLSGHLRLAFFPSAANTQMPAVLAEYHRRYPNVQLNVRDDAGESVDRAIRNREVDLGMMALPGSSDLATFPAYEDELLVVMHQDDTIKSSSRISPRALSDQAFLMPDDATADLVRSAFATAGVQPKVVLAAQDTRLLLELVRQRVGITVLPSNSIRPDQLTGLITKGLSPRVIRRVVFAAVSLAALSPAAAAFVNMLSGNSRA